MGGVTFDLDVLKVRVDAECQVARQSPWGGCPSNQGSGGVVKKREGNHHCGGVGGGGGDVGLGGKMRSRRREK